MDGDDLRELLHRFVYSNVCAEIWKEVFSG
jgi:hypothetical protein